MWTVGGCRKIRSLQVVQWMILIMKKHLPTLCNFARQRKKSKGKYRKKRDQKKGQPWGEVTHRKQMFSEFFTCQTWMNEQLRFLLQEYFLSFHCTFPEKHPYSKFSLGKWKSSWLHKLKRIRWHRKLNFIEIFGSHIWSTPHTNIYVDAI